MPPDPAAEIGVLVIVYRPRLHELQAGLDAVVKARQAGVPVVAHLWHNDDGPQATPGLSEALDGLRAAGLPLRVDGGRGNLGFGRGINAALPGIAQPFVLLLNQDAIPEPGALQRLWQLARSDDARVAAWEMRQIPYEHPKDYDPVTGDTVWCSGAAVMLRTAALRAVGGFEPRFFMYCEDVDLSWRLRCAGWRLRYAPRCAVVHRTYSHPGEAKPLAWIQGRYANLCLRARYAGRRHVIDGVRHLLLEMKGPQPFAGYRLGLLRALVKFAANYSYFRRTAQAAADFQPCLHGWDYEWRRAGAFHAFLAQAEQAQPRSLVTVLVRASPDPMGLDEWLACIENQTHRPLEVIVVGGTDPALRAVCDRWADRLDLRPLPPTTADLDDVAAVHATGDWWLTMRSERLLPYADHVEVLLAAAKDRSADLAAALTWVIHAARDARREAHRRDLARTVIGGPPASRGSRLRRRGPPPRPEASVDIDKLTTVQFGDEGA